MSPLEQLQPLAPLTPLAGEEKPKAAGEITTHVDETPFGLIFRNAIENVKETDAEKTEAQYLLATGQLDNPAAMMLAVSKNEIAVNLLIQLRNKALDVYSELSRLSV